MAETSDETVANTGPQDKDTLLGALVYLTRFHLRPQSAASLSAGIPLTGQFDEALFVRAANQAGFNAAVSKTPLINISPETLPAVILLHDDYVILEALQADEAILVDPEDPTAQKRISRQDLESSYQGVCLYCKPAATTEQGQEHWFWSTIKLSRNIYFEILVASLLINLFALVSPLFIMNVYDRVVPNYAIETLWVLASGVAIIFLFDLAMKMLRGYFLDIAGKRADILLSAQTFARVMDIQLTARPKQVGSFANNLQEFDTFREFFTSTTLTTLIDLPFVLLFLIIIYSVGGSIVLVPLVTIPVIVLVGMLLQAPLKKLIEETFKQSAKKHAFLVEALNALDTIKSNRAEGQMQSRWEALTGSLAKLSLRSRLLSATVINFSQILQQISTVAVVVVGVYLIMDGELSVGGLIACTILTGRCLAPMGQVAGILTRYHHSLAAYDAINRMMALPVERPDDKNFLHRDALSGALEFNNVTFSYPQQKVPALKEINFKIRAGEKVGIIGKMGSGKSTILKLIMGFHYPGDGAILLSDTDIHQLDPQDIRRNATFVSQDAQILSGTIRDNLTLGQPLASDQQIREAAAISGLLTFVQQHPEGFDLQVGERGSALSGGQRQALLLAQALLSKTPLLLLDEPTSSMDSTAELHFQQHLKNLSDDTTMLLVTHKANMLSVVDRLILINDGKILADGPRDQVLKDLSANQRTEPQGIVPRV